MSTLQGPSRKPLSGGKAKQLIVFLHGYGSNGEDLISLAPYFAAALPDAEFLSPNAIAAGDYGMGYQWFSLLERTPAKYVVGILDAGPKLQDYLTEQLNARGLSEADLALVGFSQGAMMALHVAARRDKPCAGVVAFSGALIGAELLAEDARVTPPVLIVHGEQDDVVPFASLAAAEDALRAHGFPVTSLARPGLAHGIDDQGLSEAVSFLKKAFGI